VSQGDIADEGPVKSWKNWKNFRIGKKEKCRILQEEKQAGRSSQLRPLRQMRAECLIQFFWIRFVHDDAATAGSRLGFILGRGASAFAHTVLVQV
jgi:hypothetical protein